MLRRLSAHAVSVSLHMAVLLLIAHAPTPRRVVPAPRADQVVVATMAMWPSPGREEAIAPPRDERPGVDGDPTLYVGDFSFDVDTIARRRDLLFPFITQDVAFTHEADQGHDIPNIDACLRCDRYLLPAPH